MNTIFVYSGTGNSLASAKQIAKAINAEVIHITAELAETPATFSGGTCVLIYPVYAYGMPMTVKHFVIANKFNFEYFAVVTTCGSYSKGAFAEAIKLLKKCGQRVHYSTEVKSVENYVHMFKLPVEETIARTIEAQTKITDHVIADIRERRTNKRIMFRPLSIFVLCVFRLATPSFARRYRFNDSCNGCGICARVCPSRAIEMVDGKPNIGPKGQYLCDHCQACLQLCPCRAIEFGKIKPDGRRYKHSDIEVSDLFKR